MTPLAYNLVHAVCWQTAWFAAVLGAGQGVFWLGPVALLPVLALHFWRHRVDRGRMIVVAAGILVVGLLVDLLLARFAGMRMASASGWSSWPQAWMAGLWLQLATALPASLAWLVGRPWLAALAGAVGGPLAYLGGERLSALTLPDGWAPVALIALAWSAALPLAAHLASPRQPRGQPCPC